MGTTTAAKKKAIPSTSPAAFMTTLLTALKAPVTSNNMHNLSTWLSNEQSSTTDWMANRGNPLGVQTPAALAAGKSGNTRAGALATASNLLHSSPSYGYGKIVAALRGNAPASTFNQAVTSSSWNGASHYGGTGTFAAKGKAQKANPTGWFGQWIEPVLTNPFTYLTPGGGMVVNPKPAGGGPPAVQSGVSALPGASAVKSAIPSVTSVSGLIKDLTSKNLWIFVAGAVLSGVGLLVFFSATKGRQVVETAAKVA